jgi:hypothetical protein
MWTHKRYVFDGLEHLALRFAAAGKGTPVFAEKRTFTPAEVWRAMPPIIVAAAPLGGALGFAPTDIRVEGVDRVAVNLSAEAWPTSRFEGWHRFGHSGEIAL